MWADRYMRRDGRAPQGKLRVLVTRDPRFLDAASRVLRLAHGSVAEDPQTAPPSRQHSFSPRSSSMSNAGVDVHPPPLILADVLPVYSPTASRLAMASSSPLASSTVERVSDDESVGRVSWSDDDDEAELRLADGSSRHDSGGLTAPLLGRSSARGSGAAFRERMKQAAATESGEAAEARSLASERDAVENGRFEIDAAFRVETKQEGHVRFDVYRCVCTPRARAPPEQDRSCCFRRPRRCGGSTTHSLRSCAYGYTRTLASCGCGCMRCWLPGCPAAANEQTDGISLPNGEEPRVLSGPNPSPS